MRAGRTRLKISSRRFGSKPSKSCPASALMRLAVRTCYDFLRQHQRNREASFSELTQPETDWLDRFVSEPEAAKEDADAARALIDRILAQLSPPARLIITLLEIEERSVKEIARL